MRIEIRLHGILQEVCGGSTVGLELHAAGGTVAEALRELERRFPDLSVHLPRTACAIEADIVKLEHRLAPGQELVLIPPVSGG